MRLCVAAATGDIHNQALKLKYFIHTTYLCLVCLFDCINDRVFLSWNFYTETEIPGFLAYKLVMNDDDDEEQGMTLHCPNNIECIMAFQIFFVFSV